MKIESATIQTEDQYLYKVNMIDEIQSVMTSILVNGRDAKHARAIATKTLHPHEHIHSAKKAEVYMEMP